MVEFEREHDGLDLVLGNIIGQVVDTKFVNNSNRLEIQINELIGIYILEIFNQNNQKSIAWIIKN